MEAQSSQMTTQSNEEEQKAGLLSIHLPPCVLGHATSLMHTCLIPNQGWATVRGYGCLTSNTKQFLIVENYTALSYNALGKKSQLLARSLLPGI